MSKGRRRRNTRHLRQRAKRRRSTGLRLHKIKGLFEVVTIPVNFIYLLLQIVRAVADALRR